MEYGEHYFISRLNIKETELSNGIHLSLLTDCKYDVTSSLMLALSCKAEVPTSLSKRQHGTTKAVVWKGHEGRHALLQLFHLS